MDADIYDRARGVCLAEKQFKDKQADFLYNRLAGRLLLRLFIASRLFSKLNALPGKTKKSVQKIRPFIERYGIDTADFGDEPYESFAAFFERKPLPGKRPFPPSPEALAAVADSKLLVYRVGADLKINIKNNTYTAAELLRDEKAAAAFAGGLCLVFRLTVDDCHRYCYFDGGVLTGTKTINGRLHTVGPVSAKRHRALAENHRIVSYLRTENFGDAAFIEVGAMLVGRIHNHGKPRFQKGEEKGYFSMGGSTIVVLLGENAARIDRDIAAYSGRGIETKVKMGEKIGEKIC